MGCWWICLLSAAADAADRTGNLWCKHWLYLPVTVTYHHPPLPVNIQCVPKYLCKTFTKKTLPVQYTVCNKSICAIHSKKISHQKWYLSLLLLNLKIKTSLVLYYRAGRYASQQLLLLKTSSAIETMYTQWI